MVFYIPSGAGFQPSTVHNAVEGCFSCSSKRLLGTGNPIVERQACWFCRQKNQCRYGRHLDVLVKMPLELMNHESIYGSGDVIALMKRD